MSGTATLDVPPPWDLTDASARAAAVRALAPAPVERAAALTALERLVGRLATGPRPAADAIPADAAEGWIHVAHRLARVVPRFGGYRADAMRAELAPSYGDGARALAAAWLYDAQARSAHDAARWLARTAREHGALPGEGPRLVALARAHWAALDEWVAEPLLSAAAAAAPADARPLLRAIEADAAAPASLRALAADLVALSAPATPAHLVAALSDRPLADPLRSWLERLAEGAEVDWRGRDPYAVAEALLAGEAVTARLRSPGAREAGDATFAVRGAALEAALGPVASASWLAAVASLAGRMLRARVVVVADRAGADPETALAAARSGGPLPRVLWVPGSESAGLDGARAAVARGERQWDGALLLVADYEP